jgi:uncharacterized SAM-binding protein YcdF (DUF218 family)
MPDNLALGFMWVIAILAFIVALLMKLGILTITIMDDSTFRNESVKKASENENSLTQSQTFKKGVRQGVFLLIVLEALAYAIYYFLLKN